MAMRHNRITIFSGAISALAIMTVLSAYVGTVATLIPRMCVRAAHRSRRQLTAGGSYTHYLSTLLFFLFGSGPAARRAPVVTLTARPLHQGAHAA